MFIDKLNELTKLLEQQKKYTTAILEDIAELKTLVKDLEEEE